MYSSRHAEQQVVFVEHQMGSCDISQSRNGRKLSRHNSRAELQLNGFCVNVSYLY